MLLRVVLDVATLLRLPLLEAAGPLLLVGLELIVVADYLNEVAVGSLLDLEAAFRGAVSRLDGWISFVPRLWREVHCDTRQYALLVALKHLDVSADGRAGVS